MFYFRHTKIFANPLTMRSLFILIICLLGAKLSATAQKTEVPGCMDAYVQGQLVKVNNKAEKDQYRIHTSKNVLMPNGGLQPVTIEVKKGKQYVINFVPNVQGRRIRLTIMDNNKNKIFSDKGSKGVILSHTFTAQYDGYYYIFVSQKVKGVKEVCGGISVLEK